MSSSEVIVRSLPVAELNPVLEITTIENTGIVTILEHNLIENRVTGLVHLGDKVVKVNKRRDQGLDHESGLQELILAHAKEDLAANRADIIWELGK